MSLAFIFHYFILNMFRMLIHPSSVACDLFVELLLGLYCSGTMCDGVTAWFGWGVVVSGCRLKHCSIIPLVLTTTGTISNKLHKRLLLLTLRPDLYILKQKAPTLNAYCGVRTFLAEQRIGSESRTVLGAGYTAGTLG